MSNKINIKKEELKIIEKLVSSNIRNLELKVSDKEVKFFKDHPLELERVTSTVATKKVFVSLAFMLGFILVTISIIIQSLEWGNPDRILDGLFTDLMFECGVALFGASVTVYLLELVLHRQEILNRQYRLMVQKKIRESIKKEE